MTKDEALRLALESLCCVRDMVGHPDNLEYINHQVAKIEAALEAKDEPVVWNGGVPAMLPKQKEGETFIVSYEPKLEAKDEPWTQDDITYRPNDLPQEFIKHEVELPEDWSEWVCPNPDEYFMKCCDCGLVHEVQYRVARYGEGDYCELVEDKDVQAQFRMRRRTPPQPVIDESAAKRIATALGWEPKRTWVGLTDEEVQTLRYKIDSTAHWTYDEFALAIEAKLKEKNT